jgi:hypothetical protein
MPRAMARDIMHRRVDNTPGAFLRVVRWVLLNPALSIEWAVQNLVIFISETWSYCSFFEKLVFKRAFLILHRAKMVGW